MPVFLKRKFLSIIRHTETPANSKKGPSNKQTTAMHRTLILPKCAGIENTLLFHALQYLDNVFLSLAVITNNGQ